MAAAAGASSLVKKIFATDKRIQFCALIDANGKVEAGGMRPGVKSLEPASETDKIVTRMFLNQAIGQAIDPYLGRADWAIIHREKLIQITFPQSDGKQLQIAASLDYPIAKVPKLGQYMNRLGFT